MQMLDHDLSQFETKKLFMFKSVSVSWNKIAGIPNYCYKKTDKCK